MVKSEIRSKTIIFHWIRIGESQVQDLVWIENQGLDLKMAGVTGGCWRQKCWWRKLSSTSDCDLESSSIFQISKSSSSLKSLVSSKSSTLLSELEFYDYHEGRPFTSHVITKRIVEIKETKTTFGSKLTNDSMENSKSKLQFTGKAIQVISSTLLVSLGRISV